MESVGRISGCQERWESSSSMRSGTGAVCLDMPENCSLCYRCLMATSSSKWGIIHFQSPATEFQNTCIYRPGWPYFLLPPSSDLTPSNIFKGTTTRSGSLSGWPEHSKPVQVSLSVYGLQLNCFRSEEIARLTGLSSGIDSNRSAQASL